MKTSITMPEFIAHASKLIGLENIKCIVEIGALDAKDSIYFKSQVPHAKVYAIEGLEDNYIKYMKDLEPNIIPINAIISNRDGTTPYYIKETNGIHSMFDRGEIYGNKKIIDKCYKFSTIASMFNIPIVDMIKIDVEGATLEVFEGMEEILDSIKIMHIETESVQFFKGQRLHEEVVKFLENRNFKLVELTSVNIMSDTSKQYDSVWIKK